MANRSKVERLREIDSGDLGALWNPDLVEAVWGPAIVWPGRLEQIEKILAIAQIGEVGAATTRCRRR